LGVSELGKYRLVFHKKGRMGRASATWSKPAVNLIKRMERYINWSKSIRMPSTALKEKGMAI